MQRSPIPAVHWSSRFFSVPLVDLGSDDERLRGISMPKPEIGAERVGLTEQFLSNADQYHVRYSASDDATRSFRNALAKIDWKPNGPLTILDIGTGSGVNSVIPCLRIFQDCTIVATDLSVDLLAILSRFLEEENLTDRVACVCTDSMKDHFKEEAFDVVVGSAILHHLINPEVALATAYRALRPGGIAIFTEPFEGWSLLGHAFKRILSQAKPEKAAREGWPPLRHAFMRIFPQAKREELALSSAAENFLRIMCIDFKARKGIDKSDIRFRYMDDKWLFTRSYIDDACRRAGFKSSTIFPYIQDDSSNHYRYNTEVLLRCSGLDPECTLPQFAWDIIAELDDLFSHEMKRDALLEGAIILRKS